MGSLVVGVRERLPWWLKVLAKLALARLPVRYRTWRAVGLFSHGSMLDAKYALEIFEAHFERVRASLPAKFSVLELGPGDSLATAIVAAVHGSTRTLLVDTARFASLDRAHYTPLLEALDREGYDISALRECRSLAQLLRAASAVYFTGGLESLRSLPNASIDFVFSQAVIEHIRRSEVAATFRELYRLQPPGGLASHRVDFQDHLAHGLNSLRFSEGLWESKFFASSGFYTNRLRASEVEKLLVAAGYEVVNRKNAIWSDLPISRRKLNKTFQHFSEDDLMVSGMDIVVRKPN